MVDTPKIWMIVTLYNRFDTLFDFRKNLEQQTYRNFEVVLVDHGTEDAPDLEVDFFTVLKGSPDYWWTDAVNYGMEYVLGHPQVRKSDYIMLQNDDVVFGPGYLAELVSVGTSNPGAVVGSICVHPETKELWYAHLPFDRWLAKYRYPHKGESIDVLDTTKLYKSDALKGRGTLYPISLVRRMGTFCKRLPHRKPDHEFAHRAKFKYEAPVFVAPEAICETMVDNVIGMDPTQPWRSFYQILFDIRSVRNLRDEFVYGIECFRFPYSLYYIVVNYVRTILISFYQLMRALLKKSGRSEETHEQI